jgi:hypothetical protein
VFERIVWPFLGRVKLFFFAESDTRFVSLENRLAGLESSLHAAWTAFESRQSALWTSLERLNLCLLSDADRTSASQLDELADMEERARSLQAELATRLAMFSQRNESILDRLKSMEVQQRSLLDTLIALDRNHRVLSASVEEQQSESRKRWESMEELMTAVLCAPNRIAPLDSSGLGGSFENRISIPSGTHQP